MSNENYENMSNNENMGNNENVSNNENVNYNDYMNNNAGFYAPPVQNMQAPKPKKKKWPVVAAAVGAVAVVGAGVGCYFAFFNKPSFDTPTDALSSCMKQLDEQFSAKTLGTTELEKKLGSAELMEALMEKGQYMDMTITLEDSDMDELAMFSGVSVGFNYANDVKNSAATLGVSGSMMGIGGDAKIYMDSEMLALTSEEFLPDTYLSADFEELLKMMAESEGMSEEELSSSMAMMNQSGAINEGLKEYMAYATEKMPDYLQNFIEDVDVEEGNTDSLEIGDEEYECYSYEVSVTAEAFKGFLEEYCSYLSEYDYGSNEFFSYIAETAALEGEEVDINEMLKEALEELPDSIDESSDETLDFTLYMSPKAQLLGIDMEEGEDSEKAAFELRFGGENPGKDIYVTLTDETEYSTTEMSLTATTATEDDVETSKLEMNINADGGEVVLKVENNYNTEDDSFDCQVKADMDMDGETMAMEVTAEGQYDEIVEGQGYSMSLDDVTISIDGDAVEEAELPFTTISFSMELECGVLEDELKKPSGTGYNILEITEEDAYEILDVLKESQTFSYILQAIPEEEVDSFINEIVGELQ